MIILERTSGSEWRQATGELPARLVPIVAKLDPDADPAADQRLAVDVRGPDEELPCGKAHRARQTRSQRRLADRVTIFDVIMLDRLAADKRPAAAVDRFGQIVI